MSDLIEVFGEIVRSEQDFPVDFDRAWQWVGYSTKGNALRVLTENFKQGEDFDLSKMRNQKGRGGDHKSVEYRLSTDCFKAFCMMAGTERGKEVRRYFLQCEKMLRALVVTARANKLTRRSLTDTLQISGEADRMHGHAYSTYTDLIYRAVLGMDAKHYRAALGLEADANVREHLTAAQAETVRKFEDLVRSMVEVGMAYEQVKAAIQSMAVRKIEEAA